MASGFVSKVAIGDFGHNIFIRDIEVEAKVLAVETLYVKKKKSKRKKKKKKC